MKSATFILEELLSRLQSVAGLDQEQPYAITEAINITASSIVEIKNYILAEPFSDETEEINFFKNVKPQFDSRMIYYLMLLKLPHKTPTGDAEQLNLFYLKEIEKLQPFYDSIYSFSLYYKMSHTYMDQQYFLRKTENQSAIYYENEIFYDHSTNTLMSGKLARLLAYDMFREYIADKLIMVSEPNQQASLLTWTARKSFAIELMYALQAFGVFNNTSVDIRKIAIYFSKVFNIHFGNIYKTWEDIRLRKKNPTPFLDALRLSLIKKIDLDNENAM